MSTGWVPAEVVQKSKEKGTSKNQESVQYKQVRFKSAHRASMETKTRPKKRVDEVELDTTRSMDEDGDTKEGKFVGYEGKHRP